MTRSGRVVTVLEAAKAIDYDEVIGSLYCFQGDRCVGEAERAEVEALIDSVSALRDALADL